jgi:hypothetical protein
VQVLFLQPSKVSIPKHPKRGMCTVLALFDAEVRGLLSRLVLHLSGSQFELSDELIWSLFGMGQPLRLKSPIGQNRSVDRVVANW